MAEDIKKEDIRESEIADVERLTEVDNTKSKCSVAWYDVVVILLLFMLSQTLGAIVSTALGVRMPGEAFTTSFDADVLEIAESMQARFVAITYAISMVLCFVMLWIYRTLRGWQWILSFRAPGWASPIRLLWGYLLMWCVSIAIEPVAELLPGNQDGMGSGGWLLISAVLLAPLFEEIIFRGYTAGILRRLYGGLAAWILSATIFGLVHIVPSVILTATLSGLVLSYFYLRYRSLVMVITLHAMNNITVCFLLTLDMGDVTVRELMDGSSIYWGLYILCVIVSVISLVRMAGVVNGIKSDNYQPKL